VILHSLPPWWPAPSPVDLQARFEAFHAENPHVYAVLVRLAREARAVGHERVGIATLFEVARWQISMSTSDPDFKLNNSFRSRYARLIMEQEPDLAGIFETRELRS
jgi:hypothetical protein